MKKPAIRILLLVVLLGLAIFYFRYMREGFADDIAATFATGVNSVLDVASNTDLDVTASATADTSATAAAGSTVTNATVDVTGKHDDLQRAAKGTSCTTVGSTTTIKGTTMYCCKDKSGASKWSDKLCSS